MEKRQKMIDRYLAGEMLEEERKIFEEKLKTDKELAKDVKLSREIGMFLQDEKRTKTVDAIREIHEEFFGDFELPDSDSHTKQLQPKLKYRLWQIVVGLLMILFVVVLFWRIGSKNDVQNENPNKTLQVPGQDKKATDIPPPLETQKPSEAIKTEDTKPQLPPKRDTEKETTDPQPIAATRPGAYLPNPILEGMMGSTVRNSSYTIQLSSPAKNQTFRLQNDGKITLDIQGIIQGDNLENLGFDLFIFNNEKERFNNNQYLLKEKLNLSKQQSGDYEFRFLAKVPFDQGLYYFYLFDEQNVNLALISKFRVE